VDKACSNGAIPTSLPVILVRQKLRRLRRDHGAQSISFAADDELAKNEKDQVIVLRSSLIDVPSNIGIGVVAASR